jgi:hypothetical protein
MEVLGKLERQLLQWFKAVPHLPEPARKWLGDNVWWIAAIGAVLSGLGIIGLLITLFGNISILTGTVLSYYVSAGVVTWLIIQTIISLVFVGVQCALLALSVNPLKAKQQKGWVLLFLVWLLGAVSVVLNAVLTLSVFNFIVSIIFGALWLAVSGYFLFEIHGQFARVEKSKGVKAAAASTKKA